MVKKNKLRKPDAADQSDKQSPWKKRLERMKAFQKKNSSKWKLYEKLLYSKEDDIEDSDTPPKHSFAWGLVKALETAIYVQNPDCVLESYDGTKMQVAKLLTNITQFDWDQMDLKSIGNLGLQDNFCAGYSAIIETLETEKGTIRFPDGEEGERATDQRYCARRVHYRDILFHPSWQLVDLSDIPYLAVAWYPTIQELRDDESFNLPSDLDDYPECNEQTRHDGMYGAKSGEYKPGQSREEKDPAFKQICVWEIHDKVNQKIIYLTDHKSKEIKEIEWPVKFKIGGRTLFPVTLMAFNPKPKGGYPIPELKLIANKILNLEALDDAILRDAKEKWRKFATFSDMLNADQLAKVVDTSTKNAVIEVDRDTLKELAGLGQPGYPDIKDIIVPIQDPAVARDQTIVRDMIKQDIYETIGYGPPDRGGMPRTRSAREAVAIKEKMEARLAKRADAIGDFYRNFGQKHVMFLQQTMVMDRYVRVFDAAKQLAEFQSYAKDDIQLGLFNFIVYAGTSAPRNTESKKNAEIQLYQTLWPAVQAGKIPMEPVILRLAEAMQWKGVDALLRNYKPVVAQLAKVLAGMTQGQVPPNILPEAAAAAVQAVLTPEELQMIAKEMQGQGQGSQPSPVPKGQRGDPGGNRAEAGAM